MSTTLIISLGSCAARQNLSSHSKECHDAMIQSSVDIVTLVYLSAMMISPEHHAAVQCLHGLKARSTRTAWGSMHGRMLEGSRAAN